MQSGVRAAGNASSTASPRGGGGSSLAAAVSAGLGGMAAGEGEKVPEEVAVRCLADYNPLEREEYQEVGPCPPKPRHHHTHPHEALLLALAEGRSMYDWA
jgi:hypothetical protein